jgi:hypothetical protein
VFSKALFLEWNRAKPILQVSVLVGRRSGNVSMFGNCAGKSRKCGRSGKCRRYSRFGKGAGRSGKCRRSEICLGNVRVGLESVVGLGNAGGTVGW